MRSSVLVPVLLLALAGAFVGCSGSGELTYTGPKDAYQKGMAQMEEEDYQQAIRLFRAVFEYGRGNQWAPKARFKLAMAQRKLNKHLVAANEFKRFTRLYRNNEMVPRAEFERANSYYLRSPMYRLDQSDSREAISLFRLFIDRYPNHELVPEAKTKINELRAKLARKKYSAGQLYERREMWNAATTVYEDVFDQYPGIEVVREQTADFQRAEAVSVVENWINAGDRLDAIVANNDEMAIGAVLVLEEAGINDDVVVTGVDATADALQYIADDRLDMTVFQNASAQGRGAVDAAFRIVQGEEVENFVEIPFEPVTSDNYQDYMD